jgi:hypothetical protein
VGFGHYNALREEKKREVAFKLLRWLCVAGVLFRAVDSPYFLDFVESICPRYLPPGEGCCFRDMDDPRASLFAISIESGVMTSEPDVECKRTLSC